MLFKVTQFVWLPLARSLDFEGGVVGLINGAFSLADFGLCVLSEC
jgi:hypothetical protein